MGIHCNMFQKLIKSVGSWLCIRVEMVSTMRLSLSLLCANGKAINNLGMLAFCHLKKLSNKFATEFHYPHEPKVV